MKVPSGLLDDVDLGQVVAAEIHSASEGIASRTVEIALDKNLDGVLPYFRGKLRSDIPSRSIERLLANKDQKSYRPLSRLSFESRIQLRALASSIEGSLLPVLDRSYEAYEAFQTATVDGFSEYIVSCDVHGFYQHIRHADLLEEIVSLTGKAEAAVALCDCLFELMGGSVGLPQLHESSDFLSEIVIDAPTRRLVRSGLTVARFNDDFRIGTLSYADALIAVETLTRELAGAGLTLNDKKTFIFKVDTYEEWLAGPEERWNGLLDEFGGSILIEDTLYGEVISVDEIEPDREEVLTTAANRALELWRDHSRQSSASTSRLDVRLYADLARRALSILGSLVAEPESTETLSELWHQQPQMAPIISRYLSSIGSRYPGAVNEVIVEIHRRSHRALNAWQASWLLAPVLVVDDPSEAVKRWTLKCFESASETVCGMAAVAGARHEWLSLTDVAERFNRAGAASRPELAAALANLARNRNHPTVRSVRQEGLVYSRIVDANFDTLSVVR